MAHLEINFGVTEQFAKLKTFFGNQLFEIKTFRQFDLQIGIKMFFAYFAIQTDIKTLAFSHFLVLSYRGEGYYPSFFSQSKPLNKSMS